MAVEQDKTGGGDIEREAKESRNEEHSRKYGKIQGSDRINGEQKDQDSQSDIQGQEEVKHGRRQRNNHDHEDPNNPYGIGQFHAALFPPTSESL